MADNSIQFKKLVLTLTILTTILLSTQCAKMNIRVTAGERKTFSPAPPSLSPGVAFISTTVINCTKKENFFLCSLRIEAVHQQGQGTPPLLKGRKLDVKISNTLLKIKNQPDANLQQGKILMLTVQSPQQNSDMKDSPVWEAKRIH